MSGYCHPNKFRTETQKKRVKEVLKVQKEFELNPKVDATGYFDQSTFKWLWSKATQKPFDPTTIEITKSDISLFKSEANDFINNIGKESGMTAKLFKLPKRLLDKMPETEQFTKSISDAISFRQRHLRENGVKVDAMLKGMNKMFYMTDYYGGTLDKATYKSIQTLETRLEKAVTPEARKKVLDEIIELTGLRGSDNNPIAGKILYRFNDLITFRETPKNQVEREIVSNWNDVRKDSASMALSGINQAKKTIKNIKDVDVRNRLLSAVERLESAANRIFFQSKTDKLRLVTDPDLAQYRIKENEIMVYDPESNTMKPHKVYDHSTNKFEVPTDLTKYAPEYVIELANTTRAIMDYAAHTKDPTHKGMKADQILAKIEEKIDLGAMVNRLKAKNDPNSEHFYSLDPAYYLNKYIHDIAHFNFATKINMEYKNAADKMLDVIRRGKYSKQDQGDWARGMLDIITDVKDSALNMHEGKITEMDNLVRFVTGAEYISKLGLSVKGALKNRTQALFDYIQFGSEIFRKIPEFYNSDIRHVEASNRQMNRFGFKFGEKATAAGTAAATRGSIDIDTTGRIDPVKGFTKESMASGGKIVEATTWAADKTSFMHKMVENKNRINTFKRAFAHSFMEMTKNQEYWIKDWQRKHSTKTEPTNEQLYSHIEFLSGNVAANMVRTLHFEYERWAKAKAFQSGPGQVLGQFQTFKWAFFDLQFQYLKNANKDIWSGNMIQNGKISPEVQKAMRLMTMYSFTTYGLSAFLNIDFTNLIANDSFEWMGQMKDWLTANPTEEEDPEHEERAAREKYGAFFGQGPILGNLGPLVSDVVALAELYDFWDRTPEEYQELLNKKYDPESWEWNYNRDRIFSNAVARWKWHVIPSLMKGQYEKAARQVTGLYKPRWVDKWIPIDPMNSRDTDQAFYKTRDTWLKESPWSIANVYSELPIVGLGGMKDVYKPQEQKGLTKRQLYKLTGDDAFAPSGTGESRAVNVLDRMLAGDI